ncbi:MAG TPA: hypothetical protein VKA54_10390 [Gemmatimonadaceae bacterium]|nr:hypothetical protein [Gemmatimonadaceae bacterium]
MSVTRQAAGPRPVVEWAPFRVVDGVTEQAVLAASDSLQRDFLARQRGFVRRELLRGPDGQWVDLVHWEDEAAAHAVFTAAMESPVCAEYFKLMVMPEGADPAAGVLHLHRVREYAGS